MLDAAGKIGNIPNTIIGLAWGGIGMLGGADVSIGKNAIQFTNHPFTTTAVTIGNVISYNQDYSPGAIYGDTWQHEIQHTFQGQQLGPLYLLPILPEERQQLAVDHSWHGPTNWNERGPQMNPQRVW